jgi:hypothetical protein
LPFLTITRKISAGFFEGPDVFQGIAIGESAKQCGQGRFTKHYAPHPCTGQNAGCAQHWRSNVALDDNPARNRPIYSHRHVQTRKRKRTNGRCRALTKRYRERYDIEQDFYGT